MYSREANMARGKRIFSISFFIMAILFILYGGSAEAVKAAEIIASGTCGIEATWSLDDEGTLTIGGSGAMTDYTSSGHAPWYESYVEDYINAEEGIITSIVVEDGITKIGDYAFFQCSHVTNVTVGTAVTEVGVRSFAFCTSLPEIDLPEIAQLGDYAFEACSSLNKYHSNGYRLSLGNYAFYNCSSLTEIRFRTCYLFNVNYTQFVGCSSLKRITLDYQEYYGSGTFRSLMGGGLHIQIACGNYRYKYKIVFCPAGTELTSFEETGGYTCEIAPYAFYNCDTITKIRFQDALETIGENAFRDCDNVTELILGRRVEFIGEYAFAGCRKLSSFTIPGCVRTIGEKIFEDCDDLETVYFRGDCPQIEGAIFPSDHAITVYYPVNNSTWTQNARERCGGNTTWIAYSPELSEFSDDYYIAQLKKTLFTYDGSEKEAEVNWVAKRDLTGSYEYEVYQLTPDVNYYVDYRNNILSGTGEVLIHGMGEYEGTIVKTFDIQPTVSTEEISGTYDGKRHELVIAAEGDATLYFSVTTPLTYDNYSTAGTTTVPSRITAGTTAVYYIAIPNNNPTERSSLSGEAELTIAKGSQSLQGELTYPNIFIGNTSQIIASAKAGAISYSSSNENIATVDSNGLVTGVSEGTAVITVSAAETSNYVAEEITLEITVSPYTEISLLDCTIEVENGLIYTGSPLEPGVTIQYEGIPLVQGKDYSLQYINNTEVGTGTVIIVGTGYCVGTVTKNFTIVSQATTKSILDCSISLSSESLIYNAAVQVPAVIISDGGVLLQAGTDYSISHVQSIDTGSYNLTIEGIGGYSGVKTLSYEILPANPILTFEASSIEKNTEDSPFTNPLTAVTDSNIVYSSGDSSIAVVDLTSGQVTIKGAGTTTIQVQAFAGRNYLAGEASYTLVVTESVSESPLNIQTISYSFRNVASAFGYPSPYFFALARVQAIYGETTKALLYYSEAYERHAWNGNCEGISATAALLFDGTAGVTVQGFNSNAAHISDLNVLNSSSEIGMNLRDFIEIMQIAQSTQLFRREDSRHCIYTKKDLKNGNKNLNAFYQAIRTETEAGRPVILCLRQNGGHAVLAYAVKDISSQESQILLYDSNYPRQERIMTLTRNGAGNFMNWSYEIGQGYGTWGTNSDGSSISYVVYDTIKEIWTTRGHLIENDLFAMLNSMNVAIYDSSDHLVATLTHGELSANVNGIEVVEDLSLEPDEDQNMLLAMPVGIYTFENLDKSLDQFEVAAVNTYLGCTVATSAKSVTLAVDDSCNLNAAYIDASENDTYSVTLNSCLSTDNDSIIVSGMGSGERLEVSSSGGNINISNCQILSINIDGQEVAKFSIQASAGTGGTIAPVGETVLTKGQSAIYTIAASAGYTIKDVLVDGKSVGAVRTYKFDNIAANHIIRAEFKKNTPEETDTPNGSDEKEKADKAAADAVIAKINALSGTAGATDQGTVDAARAAYNSLTNDQKALISAEVLKKLTTAENQVAEAKKKADADKKAVGDAADKITAIPALENLTLDNVSAVEEAAAAYEKLTEEGKAKVPAENVKKLQDAQTKVAALKTEEKIVAIPDVKALTQSDAAIVSEAAAAYAALSETGKAAVSAETVKKLQDAQAKIAALNTASGALGKIAALPAVDAITLSNAAAVEEAAAAFEKLPEEARAAVPAETMKKLQDAQEKVAALKAGEKVVALPETDKLSLDNAAAVEEAQASYDALSEAAKIMVPADTVKKLNEATSRIKMLKAEAADPSSLKNVEKAIISQKDDKDPKGSTFAPLKAKAASTGKTSVKISWAKVKNAKGYVIYGNACGKKNKMVKIATANKNKYTVKKISGKALKAGTYYKLVVVAYGLAEEGYNKTLATSKVIHAATTGGKYTNPKKVTVNATKATAKKGKKYTIKAKQVSANSKLTLKKHRALSFESSNTKIATVSSKGVVTGKKKGTVTIYVYAQNGVCATVKVTVK